MKKPADKLQINTEDENDLLCEYYRIAYALIGDYGMSEQAAGELAELAVTVQVLTNLKNDLEGMQ